LAANSSRERIQEQLSMNICPICALALILFAAPTLAQEKPPEPVPAPPAKVTVPPLEPAIARAVALLIERQESLDPKVETKREWPYEGVYREAKQIPIGYRIGGTAIAAWALIESPQYAASQDAHAAVERALGFVLDALGDKAMSADFRGTYDVRGWGHTYALNLMLRMRALKLVPEKQKAAVEKWIPDLVEALQKTEIPEKGGWNYARGDGGNAAAPASPFMTAPTLLALFEARAQGEKVDDAVVTRALDALEGCRTKDGAIPYTTAGGRDEWPGAIGRTPITEVVLALAGRGDTAKIRRALDNFLEHWEWLEKRRKQQGTHVPPYMIAPYYFFYAHGYAAMAIQFLPEAERAPYRERFLERLFQVQEEDGGWNDRVFARSEAFGTSMGLLALIAPSLPAPAGWKATAEKTPAEK
jgi:hypothetical protein